MTNSMNSSTFQMRLKKAVERQPNMELLPKSFKEDTEKAARCMSCPSMGILVGTLLNLQYVMSYAFAKVQKTDWIEPLLSWPLIFMPSGTRKSSIHKFTIDMLYNVEKEVNKDLDIKEQKSFTVQECTIEKLGRLMEENNGKKVWFLDEGDILFQQIGMYSKERQITREEAVLLQSYNGSGWKHETVTSTSFSLRRTSLIVGGLTQSKKATKILQEDKIDSGLLPRFIFLFLEPVFEELDSMKPVNNNYRLRIHNMLLDAMRSHGENDENVYTLFRQSPAYIKFRKFYSDNISAIESTCYNPNNDLINAFKGKLPGKVLRLSATLTCLFSMYSEKSKKEMQEYENEQEINLKEELADITIPEMSQSNSQEEDDEIENQKMIKCMAMDFAIEVVSTSYQQIMEILGGEPTITKIEKSMIGKLIVFGGKVLHLTVINDTHYLGKGIGRNEIEKCFETMEEIGYGKKSHQNSGQKGNRKPVIFEMKDKILEIMDDNALIRKSLYDNGVSYSELESAINKPNRIPRKRHLVEDNSNANGGKENVLQTEET